MNYRLARKILLQSIEWLTSDAADWDDPNMSYSFSDDSVLE